MKKTDSNHSKEISSEIIIKSIEDVVQEKIVMIEIRTDRQDSKPRNSYYNQDNRRQYSPYPRSENNNFKNRSQSFENRDRRYCRRSNDRRPQDYRYYSRERQYDRNDSRTRYRESNSPRQDYRRNNSSNQNSRDNRRDRNSNRVQFGENKVNGFFVDNQQDEISLN